MKKNGYKLFVLRKNVKARNAPEAMRLAKKIEWDDVFISDDWKEGKIKELATAIGFSLPSKGEEE